LYVSLYPTPIANVDTSRLSLTNNNLHLSFLFPPPPTQTQGAYRLSIDGALLAAGPGRAVPSTSSSYARVHDAIDVTHAFAQPGSHVLALQGYYAGMGQAGIHLVVRLWSATGEVTEIVTAGNWAAHDATAYFGPTGNTGGSYDQPAENQDARQWPGNWTAPNFSPGDGWSAAEVQAAFSPLPQPKRTSPIEITQEVRPAVSRQFAPGSWFYDFGSEGMYGLRLVVNGVSCSREAVD
jgi:hypothetical protein